MNILISNHDEQEKNTEKNAKIWELISNILSKVFTSISVSKLTVNWLENFDNNKSYLIIWNHPSCVDGFLLRDFFQSHNIDVKFIMHNSLIESAFLWDYFKKKWHIWVLSKRNVDYYMQKWLPLNQATKKFESRFNNASYINKRTYIKSKEILNEWLNLFIFITGAWYLDLHENPEIFNWYKKIISDYLNDNESLEILPMTLNFSKWIKNASIALMNDVLLDILPPIKVTNLNVEDIHKKIKLIYNPWISDV